MGQRALSRRTVRLRYRRLPRFSDSFLRLSENSQTLELKTLRTAEKGAQRALSCNVTLPKPTLQRPLTDFSDSLSRHIGE
jgi:hypothetical protein